MRPTHLFCPHRHPALEQHRRGRAQLSRGGRCVGKGSWGSQGLAWEGWRSEVERGGGGVRGCAAPAGRGGGSRLHLPWHAAGPNTASPSQALGPPHQASAGGSTATSYKQHLPACCSSGSTRMCCAWAGWGRAPAPHNKTGVVPGDKIDPCSKAGKQADAQGPVHHSKLGPGGPAVLWQHSSCSAAAALPPR